ncbi:ice-binding family protein [Streptosporangium sp. NPDC048047]|uniref:ice-binding family protein n=1 Tax=Streptosporangium sp. NPDC048047 TaxID=3155748 RepID=UPI00341F037C
MAPFPLYTEIISIAKHSACRIKKSTPSISRVGNHGASSAMRLNRTMQKEKDVFMMNTGHPSAVPRHVIRSWIAGALTALVAMGGIIATPHAASAVAPAPVPLGTAANFAVLAGTTVTNTGATVVTGDLGVSPGSAVTGFPPGVVVGTTHQADAAAAQAQLDLTAAYTDAAGRTPDATIPTELGGTTLTPGVYNSASGTFEITGNLTLDAQGDPNAVFIFQMASTLVTASASTVTLIGGAQACNVFWQVGSSATLGTGSSFAGNILALTSITVTTGVTVNGRTLARNGAVTLDTDRITRSVCQVVPPRTTSTALTSTCVLGRPGSITLTATVTSSGPTPPTGTVEFFSDGVSLGTAPLDATGRARLVVTDLPEGTHRIVAAYPGSALLDPSASPVLLLRVGPDGLCPVKIPRIPEKIRGVILQNRDDQQERHSGFQKRGGSIKNDQNSQVVIRANGRDRHRNRHWRPVRHRVGSGRSYA